MPYFVSDEQDDCDGWATIKIDADGTVETIGCHDEMNEAVAQMIAVSLDEGEEPGGEFNAARSDHVPFELRKRADLSDVREVREWHLSNIEVREQATDGTVTFSGYATVFDADYQVHDAFGEFTERIASGAFTQTLSQTPDVILNINHGAGGGLPLARTKSGTLQLVQDGVGLRVEARLDAADPDVQALLPKMRRGDVDEMSFAFRVPAGGSEWSADYSDRTITNLNLHRGDVSIVSFGANPATLAMVRSALANDDVRAQVFAEFGDVVQLRDSDVSTDDAAARCDCEPAVDAEIDVDEVDVVRCQGSGEPMAYYYRQLLHRAV